MISLVAEPAEDEDFIQLIQKTGWTYKNNQRQAKNFSKKRTPSNPNIKLEK